MPVVASATLEVTPVLAGAQQSLTQQLTGASVQAGDKAGQESGNKFASSMAKKIAVGSVAVAGAVTAVGGALVSTASKTAQYGDSIDKASQKLGVSSSFYQEWEAVLQHSGTSMDKMGTSFKRLATASQDASDDQVKAFERIGLSMEDVKNMSTEDLFSSVIAGLQGMEEGSERTATATELLGKGAMELGPLFNTSAKDTQAMIDRVNDLGGVMGEDAVKASARYQDSLQDMQTAFDGVKNGIGAKLLPVMADFMDGVSDFIANTDFSPFVDTIGGAIDALGDFIGNLDIAAIGGTFMDIVGTIGSIIGGLAGIIVDVVAQAQTQGTFFNAVWEGISAVVQGAAGVIQGVIDFVSALINGDWSGAWNAALGIVSTVNKTIQSVLSAVWKALKSLASSAWQAIKNAITMPITQAKSTLQGVWSTIKSTASNMWNALKSTASSVWNGIKTAISTPILTVKSTLSSAWQGIKSTASGAWNGIKSAITKPLDNAKSAIKGIIDKIKGMFPISIGKWLKNLPKITLETTTKTVLGKTITIPTSFKWHAKAMEQPYMFQGATLFGAGEAGDEILYGREKLLMDIREATGGGGGYTQNITINSPQALNPSEVARQTRLQTRGMVLRMRTT
ncbi:MAG: hypothetical protein J6E40_06600 [Lachnospiraceae bacterium]|nr:hypothetical protein [Lachnospiraceae bacterium]